MAVDYFLEIKGVEGETRDEERSKTKDIDVLSFSWGESNGGSMGIGGGGGAGKVNMQDFHFTMTQNRATPTLMKFCANGKHISEATLRCRRAGEKPHTFMTIKFTDIVITSYQIGASGGHSDLPTDSISFNYTKIDVEYKEQDEKTGAVKGGAVLFGHDVKTNTTT